MASASADAVSISPTASSRPQQDANVYEPLDSTRKEIRLLKFLPSAATGKLVCELVTASLLDKPQYDCLSYCWGEPMQRATISINGHDMSVTRNLHAALCCVRNDDSTTLDHFFLWADAICINQDDIEERNHQVAQMFEIYKQAVRVLCWLDWRMQSAQEADNATAVLVALEKVGVRRVDKLSTKALTEILAALCPLFKNIYWTRRWITQELVAAREMVLCFAHCKFTLQPITLSERLPACYYTWTARRQNVATSVEPSANMQEQILVKLGIEMGVPTAEVPMLNKDIPRDMKSMMPLSQAWAISPSSPPSGRSAFFTNSGAAQFMFGLDCSEMHDHVFALQSFVPADWHVAVHYEQPWQTTFAQFTKNIYQSTRDLDTLQWACYDHSSLPSWSVDWSSTDPALYIQVVSTRYNADLDTHHHAVASDPELLTVGGLEIASVISKAQNVIVANMPDFASERAQLSLWLLLYMQGCQCGSDPYTSFTRVLLMDKAAFSPIDLSIDQRQRISEEQLELYATKLKALVFGGVNTGDEFWNRTLLRRVQRTYFSITANGLPCLSTRPVQEGDVVWVLAGSGTPYVLRPVDRDGVKLWRIISHCYVDGIMYGEAVQQAVNNLRTQEPDAAVDDVFRDITLI